jgi:hypothetical protein
MNFFRRNPVGNAISVLQSRLKLYKSGPHHKAASRNPAWVRVTGTGNSCAGASSMSLPVDTETFDSTYQPTNRLKLKPILKDVVLEYGGEFGMTQTIEITIQCHSRQDFEQVEQAFLLPGNIINVSFGYGKSWNDGDQKSQKAGPFRVASFSFNTTSEGYWICTCKAVAAVESLKGIEISSIINDTNLYYKAGNKSFQVFGMAELIAYDAQKNGTMSIDQLQDGETINVSGGGSIVVYHADHLFSTRIGSWFNALSNKFDSKTEAEQTFNVVYVTLEYIIKRLVMGQIVMRIAGGLPGKDSGDFKKLKIVLDPKISVSYVDQHMTSGSPVSCLLLGKGKGNYKGVDGGKDFEKDCKNLRSVTAVLSGEDGRNKIDLRNILLERSVIVKAFTEAAKNRQATADSIDVKDTKDLVLPLDDFLKKIFDHIGIISGGALQLRLVVHPNDTNTMVIVDQNNGKMDPKLQVVVLDPIDGDGSTRSCTIQSNVGSEEYKHYLFTISKKGDIPAELRNCKESTDKSRAANPYKDSVDAVKKVTTNPGTLGANAFGAVQENSLLQSMGTMTKNAPKSKKFEMIPYLGMSIEAELDGVFGLMPGNGILTTQLPKRYKNSKMYFSLKGVTHTFAGDTSTWTTKLSGFLTFYDNITYIDL